MKKLITLLFVITTIFVNSQSLEKLDSVSAYNLYVATNKKQVLTIYETVNKPTYVFYYGDGDVATLNGYEFIMFNTKNDLINFLDLAQRSIIKNNMIIYRVEKNKILLKGVTKHTTEINLNEYKFYLNVESIKDIKYKLNEVENTR